MAASAGTPPLTLQPQAVQPAPNAHLQARKKAAAVAAGNDGGNNESDFTNRTAAPYANGSLMVLLRKFAGEYAA